MLFISANVTGSLALSGLHHLNSNRSKTVVHCQVNQAAVPKDTILLGEQQCLRVGSNLNASQLALLSQNVGALTVDIYVQKVGIA